MRGERLRPYRSRRVIECAERCAQTLGVEVAADEDEPRPQVLIGPLVEVHRRVDSVLDAVDEHGAVAADVQQVSAARAAFSRD